MSTTRIDGNRQRSGRLREEVWDALDRASFAVISHVAPDGGPRSSGVVYAVNDHRLYLVTARDSWKSRQIADGDEVAVTVPVRRGGLVSLVAPIPPATVSFRARVRRDPPGITATGDLPGRLRSLLPRDRSSGEVLELTPTGAFVTYGVGVSLRDMTHPERAAARVPVSG